MGIGGRRWKDPEQPSHHDEVYAFRDEAAYRQGDDEKPRFPGSP